MNHLSIPLTVVVFVLLSIATAQGDADEPVHITVFASPTPAVKTEHRLLPIQSELRHGNAAVVLLRMTWEQQRYMQNVVPQIPGLLELPFDDPAIAEILQFDHFYRQLNRAAYIADAEWNYPFGEEPHVGILIPDVQGMRVFLGRGMKLWVGTKIAEGDYDAAREGLLTQLAGARHVARTPILVNHLVANTISNAAFDRMEIMSGRPDSPNLYWALSMLPRSNGDVLACLDWEAGVVRNSVKSLSKPLPPVGDEAWLEIVDEFSDFMITMMNGRGLSLTESGLLIVRMDAVARQDLIKDDLFTKEQVDKMSHQESIMRWVLRQNEIVHGDIRAAFSLPPAQAIEELAELEMRIAAMLQRTGAPSSPFPRQPLGSYLALFQYERRAKMLQVVEAIRDHLSRNDGVIPETLSQIKTLHVPDDPFTARPFEYERIDGVGHLKTPDIPGLDADRNASQFRHYILSPGAAQD